MSRRHDETEKTCAYSRCRRPIVGQQLAELVATCCGPMHRACYDEHAAKVEAWYQGFKAATAGQGATHAQAH